MYQFQRFGTDVTTVVLHPSNTPGNSPARFEVAGIEPTRLPDLTCSDTSAAEVTGPSRTSASVCRFMLRVRASGMPPQTITVEAFNIPLLPVSLIVTIVPGIALPARNTDQGAVARVLMAEARGPLDPAYSEADSLTAMQWMRLVLENRLANNPRQFMTPGAKNLIDIIKAPGQIGGFEHYPAYAATQDNQDRLNIANDDNDRRAERVGAFIQNAINVANALSPVADPSPAGSFLAAWRTQRHGSPGSRYVEFASHGNNTFFTLAR